MLLLTEIAGAISRRTGIRPSAGAPSCGITQLPEIHLVAIDDQLWQQATELAAALGLRGAAAVYVALPAQLQTPLVTWDREQHLRGAQRIVTREPA